MRVAYTTTVKLYLRQLIKILYDNHYFSYEEASVKYVNSLLTELKATIHLKHRKKAPNYFSKYGDNLYYVTHSKNKRTTWYFFFTQHANDIYVIRYITNNHVEGHFIESF